MICDEAHTALGEKTSAAIRSFPEPIYIGMTATEQLIAKQVSDVFPASVDDLPLADAARRGLIAPLRCLRVPPVAAINQVPIVGGDFEERALAEVLDHQALNQAAASLYRDRFDNTPGIVYAAGVDHAYNLAKEFRAAGHQGRGRQRPHAAGEARRDARRLRARRDQRPDQRDAARRGLELAARDRLHAPRADGLAPRLPAADRPDHAHAPAQGGRHRRRLRPEGLDPQRARRSRSTRCSTPTSTARAPASRPAPRRRMQRRARRRLTPAPWLVPVTPDVRRRLLVIQREWQRIDPRFLDEDEQRFWATIAGRNIRYEERMEFAKKFAEGKAGKGALEQFLATCAAENPNRRLRMTALADRVSMTVERADFDDLVTLVTQAPTWEKDRAARRPRPAAGDRRGQGERARPDPRALDVAARPRDAEAAGPPRERRVPRGEAAARRARELARPPARGERGEARQRRARAADRGRRRAARLGRGLHAAREPADRRRPRAARRRSGRSRTRSPRTCPRRSSSRAARAAAGAAARRRGRPRRRPRRREAAARRRTARPRPRTATAPAADTNGAKPKRRRRRKPQAAAERIRRGEGRGARTEPAAAAEA